MFDVSGEHTLEKMKIANQIFFLKIGEDEFVFQDAVNVSSSV